MGNDKPRQRFTRCPPSQKPTDPRVRPRPSESQPERFLTTLKRPASFIPPKMRPSQERSARLSEPLLLAHLSPPVPFSSSSLAVSVASVSSPEHPRPRCSPRHWPIQDQRCPPPQSQRPLRYRHFPEG